MPAQVTGRTRYFCERGPVYGGTVLHYMRNLSILLFWTLVLTIPGCQCADRSAKTENKPQAGANNLAGREQPPAQPGVPNPVPATITASGAMELSEEMRQNLLQNFTTHLEAQNSGDFKTHVSYFYQPMLDRVNKDSLELYMGKFYKLGCRNNMIGYEVDKISPIVETDSTYVVMLRAKVKLDVVFDPKFDKAGRGTPEDWGGMVRDQYPTAVYDAPNRTYHIEEKMKYYCLTAKDTLDFRFLVHAYYNDKRLANLLDYDTFYQLRVYEK